MSASTDSLVIDLAVGTTHAWTAIYTWRLSVELRNSRRAEIESDLWEHQEFARLAGESSWQTALGIVLRFLLGLPSDLSWRLETGAMVRSQKGRLSMSPESGIIRALAWASYLLIGLLALISLGAIVAGTGAGDLSWAIMGGVPLVASVPIIYGLSRSASRQPLAIVLVATGCVAITTFWFWLFMFTIPTGAGLIALSYYRGKRAGWRVEAPTDLAT